MSEVKQINIAIMQTHGITKNGVFYFVTAGYSQQ